MMQHYDSLEVRSTAHREQELLASITRQISHARENTATYATRLRDYDAPLTSLGQLQHLPVTRKAELIKQQQQHPPLGGLIACKQDELAYLFASPGPIYEFSTRRPDYWRFARALFAAGVRAGDVVQNCFSYHLTPAGQMGDSGCHALGCSVIPAGVGQTDLQAQTIHDLKPNGYLGTPSFLNIILQKAEALKLDTNSLKKALVSGEALPPSLRNDFIERGITTLQCYATADLGLIAYESSPQSGLIIDEGVYLEIVRPGTGDVVADGEVGEVVVTTLNADHPLIRFATGDLSAILEGSSDCGRTNRRIAGWMGRADQTVKVRGMFIHPEQIENVRKRHPEIIKARLIVDALNHRDQMTLHCETATPSGELEQAIEKSIKDLCKVRGEVALLPANTIANDGLVIEDVRQYE